MTLFMLVTFVLGVLILILYAGRTLYRDIGRMAGEQQLAVTSTVAAQLDGALRERFSVLETVAAGLGSDSVWDPATLQMMLEQRPVLHTLFNAGTFVTALDGGRLASLPLSAKRDGAHAMDHFLLATVLKSGQATVSPPVIDKRLPAPAFSMAVPIRDPHGKVMGVLAGVTELDQANFLEKIVGGGGGKMGEYLVVAAQHRLIVTASNRALIGTRLPNPGAVAWVDRSVFGYQGYGPHVNEFGAEVLSATKRVPVAGWYVSTSQSAATAFAVLHNLLLHLLIAALFLSLGVAWLTWWMVRRQLAPMLAATRMMDTLAAADQTQQVLAPSAHGELGDLLSGLNRVLETVAKRETALRESAETFRAIASCAVNWEVWWGLDGKPHWINPSVKEYTGYTVEECMAMPNFVGTLVYAEDMPIVRPAIQQGRQGLSGNDLEFRAVHKDGTLTWLSLSWVPLYDTKGAFRGVRTSGRDITDRKRAEENLRASEHMLSEILDSVPAYIYLKDAEGRYLFINRMMSELFDLAAVGIGSQREETSYDKETVNRVRSEYFSPEMIAQMRANDLAVFQMGEPVRSEDFLRAKDGRTMVFFTVKLPLRNEKGEIYALCGVSTDVTERKQSEMAMAASELRLKAESASKTMFLAQMSHELRTPLDTILGNAQLLARRDGRAQWEEGLATIQKSGWHLLGMIDEILDHARGVSDKLTIEPDLVDWPRFLRDVAQNGQLLAIANHNEFSLVTNGLPLRGVMLDGGRVRQVLDNLMANAARHTKSGWIRLESTATLASDGRLRLDFAVADSGDGIVLADQERIFLPFERGSTSGRAGGKGIGIGLTISRQLAQAMGGQLTVKSTPGEGACFQFWLTAEVADPFVDTFAFATTRHSLHSYIGPRRTVLVVDDEPAGRHVLRRLLEGSGFVVLEAASGQSAALVLGGQADVDVVMTDQFMADGDGWMVLQTAATDRPGVPVVLISAAAPKRPASLPAQLGFAAQLLKPLNHAELLTRIGELLGLQWQIEDTEPSLAEVASDPQDALLSAEELEFLREMISGGQISNIMAWVDALKARQPKAEKFALAVAMAAHRLDFPGLAALASVSDK